MDSRAFWLRLKTHRWVYTLSIAATLALGILIGTVVSYGVKGKEGQKSSDATPLTIPSPKQLSNCVLANRQAVGAERGQYQYRVDDQESAPAAGRAESRR